METRNINEENITEGAQSEKGSVDLKNDYCKTSERDVSHKSKPRNTFRSRTCSYFYNYGYCKFGNSCKYKHYRKRNNNDNYVAKEKNSIMSKSVLKNKNVDCESRLQNINSQTSSKQVCQNFKAEECIKCDSCEIPHSLDISSDEMPSLNPQKSSKKNDSDGIKSTRKRTTPLCYYFKKGMCYKGNSCKYYHPNKDIATTSVRVPAIYSDNKDNHLPLPDKVGNGNPVNEDSAEKKHFTINNKSLNFYDLSSLAIGTISQLRSTEINQLKKRFPHFEVSENESFSVIFQPTNPDWAFDVKTLKLEVIFPPKYPTEKCKITVVHSDENIPLLLIKYLNKAICEWISKKFEENNASNKTELMFRSFLKWFDRNLEDLFITGLKKVKQDLKAKEDGIEFVPVEDLFPSSEKNFAEESLEENNCKVNTSELKEQPAATDYEKLQPLTNESNKSSNYFGSNGLKIIFSGLELTEAAAALVCKKISITLQCCRCKTSFHVKSVPKKNNSHVCSKCSKNVGFTFDPSTIHQFSSVLGTLHLLDCIPMDINLVECHFLIDCLNCSKQVLVDGIHYGQKHKMWCIFCNEKMLISIGSVKFQSLKLPSFPDSKYMPVKKIEKKVKGSVIKEGEPLPNFGACKHYKKSFRWLRFPCCGRLYPCDECHNEKETSHEMKYASRMMCGFCGKEQPYSREKPCILCSASLTKKSGSHWEGGRGCRNKIQMSREDKHKYSGVCKTVSKKAQNAKKC